VALSQVGISTLLIDGDMRAPGLENFIRPSAATDGLRQYLSSRDAATSDAIHPEVVPNLSVMYAGGVAANAQELLGSDAFKRLIERCLRDFEFTIVDTPPGDACADNLRISAMVGYTLVVARADVSRANEVAALSRQLRDDGADVIGSVLSHS
jgi:capsular exopolysaccharide synthesis family protein